ncbi:MAG: hypothetical protein J7647_30265, partial [Cyanobacteria bacterium SBLK]|nr:hypothetical protein [Cyanobacteria bacterium SBLK]
NGHGVLIDNQVPGRFNDNFYVYRWIDAVGEGKAFGLKDAAAVFHEKTDEGLGGFKPQKEVDLFVPASIQTNFTWTGSPDFTTEMLSNNKVLFEYNPDLSDVEPNKVVQKPITLEINKGVKIGQIAASVQPHLRFDDYWVPSTDTLDLPPDKRHELFDRIFSNEEVSKFYLDVFASKGPTVNYPYFLPDNILSGQRDSMDDFYGERDGRGLKDKVEIVPWFEGTGRIANTTGFYNWYNDIGARFNTKDNLHYIDIFNGKIDKNNDNEKTGWDMFIYAVNSFVRKYKQEYDFSSVIVDDHFGIAAKTAGNVDIMKQRLKDRDENFKNESNDISLKRGLADLVSKRVKDLRDFLWTNHVVALSVSVNPFTFKKAEETVPQENAEEPDPKTGEKNSNLWHNALQTNYHDVAKWIEEGYIRGDLGGEINVQIYREDPYEVIKLYDKLRQDLTSHLKGKLAEYKNDNDADFTDYWNKFPKIAVSLAAEGRTGTDGQPWKGNRENIAIILNHINANRNNIVKIDDDREFTIRVSAFDGDDFHTLPPKA